MKRRELENMGLADGPIVSAALRACALAAEHGFKRADLRRELQSLCARPGDYRDNPIFGETARLILESGAARQRLGQTSGGAYALRENLRYAVWGEDIDDSAHAQMANACKLPISIAAALMPDAHVGYGLPIGGVLATEGAVIPYAVGVDIACRVKVTVFDLPPERMAAEADRYERILERETRFGVGAQWSGRERPAHDVMDENWNITPLTRALKDKAWSQLGTSGSGNHFVEFGELIVPEGGAAAAMGVAATGAGATGAATVETAAPAARLDIAPGRYLALVSHSGSRGTGAQICSHYSKIARELHPHLPKELSYLAWLPMDGAGAEYWAAMELAGLYASANHDVIHRKIIRAVGADVLRQIENHHNFAWKEWHAGRELIVHRKGATPAGPGVIGYIPGTMAAPGYIVAGLGEAASLHSASHGAGRRLSRTKAKESIRWSHLRSLLQERGVKLLSAGLDESPHAYKDIDEVMAAQAALVRKLATFHPRLVKMAPEGEAPED